jgi:hypothetical protein
MAETPLEMAKRHLRESEELVARQRDIVGALEQNGDQQALQAALARLHFLEAARDTHRTLLNAQSAGNE